MKGYILFRTKQVAVALGLVTIAFLLRVLLDPILQDRLPYTLFLLAAILAAWLTGVGEALLVLVLGWLAANWFFEEPRHSLAVRSLLEWMTSLSYWFIGGAVLLFAKAQRSAHLRELNASVELRRREAAVANYRNVFDLAPVGLAQVEFQSGLLLHVNPKLCQLTGYQEEELLCKRLWELVSAVEGPSDWPSVSRRLTSGPVVLEVTLARKDGTMLRLNLRAAPGPGGELGEPLLACVLEEPVSQAQTSPSETR